jgi:hypothetical protein
MTQGCEREAPGTPLTTGAGTVPAGGGGAAVNETTRPSSETREAERAEASTPAHADREATPEEAELADRNELDPEVVEHEREMAERGSNQKGEGRVP